VTFTFGSFRINFSGGGKKSAMTAPSAIAREIPFGASVYITSLLFIRISPFSPISGTKYADIFMPHSKPNGDNAVPVIPYTEKPLFFLRMFFIRNYHAVRIKKRSLCDFK
jgi:hypothetical protein